MVATHDMEQTRAWDRVLCLNRRQVAFGPPGDVLTREVLERTYGGSIVMLPGDGERRGVLPAHHHDHHVAHDAAARRRRRHAARARGAAASSSRALIEVALLGARGRPARLLGRALRPLLQRGVAVARAVSRAW